MNRFSVTKIEFMLLQTKLTSEIRHREGILGWKIMENQFQKPHFVFFSLFLSEKKLCSNRKMKNPLKFSIMKIADSMCLQLKIILKIICQKVMS